MSGADHVGWALLAFWTSGHPLYFRSPFNRLGSMLYVGVGRLFRAKQLDQPVTKLLVLLTNSRF
jgi:hypothetical protein